MYGASQSVSTEGAGDSGQVLARLELPEPKTGEEIELPLEKLSTKKGTGAVYQLRFTKIGRYELVFRMSSTLGPLAQYPISVFLNNTLQQTVTINGTEGKVVEQSVTLAIRQDGEKYMKLYFGEAVLICTGCSCGMWERTISKASGMNKTI